MITITRAQIAAAFPISRDPPEGGTLQHLYYPPAHLKFPISRDPPEGGTSESISAQGRSVSVCFQFLGIPPKGERLVRKFLVTNSLRFPISRDPPEGGTHEMFQGKRFVFSNRGFQFLGIPPKGEL